MYVCRTLSYKGADFEVIEAPLEEKMMVHNTSWKRCSNIMMCNNFSTLPVLKKIYFESWVEDLTRLFLHLLCGLFLSL